MAKLIVLVLASGLFFSVGLIAGQRVSSTDDKTHARSETFIPRTKSTGHPATPSRTVDTGVDSTVDGFNPHLFVSSTSLLPADDVASAEPIDPAFEDPRKQDSIDAKRASILKLIQQRFPDTDAAVAEVWADTYAEMDPDEVSFILDQKHRISSGLSAAVALPPGSSAASVSEHLKSTPEPAVSIAVRMVETNLNSAYSLGFCRMAIFPETGSHLGAVMTATSADVPTTSFRCFESGPLIQSPIATHVALSKSDSSMFLLDNNRLTRRGDFQLLNDRRLGIKTSHGEFAAAESTSIPEDAARIRITTDGVIQYQNAASEISEAGRISVCTIKDFSELQSADGVIFESINSDEGIIDTDAAGLLVPNSLEQSNVDRTYENSLLTILKSQRQTSL